MNNSTLFKQAHAMTKQVIKQGDNYNVTFGLCLKAIKAKNEQVKKDNVAFTSISLFMVLAILAVAVGSGVIAVISVFISVLTLIGYSLQNEIKQLKKVFTADNIAGAFIVLPIVFMFAYLLIAIIAYRPIY